MRVTSDLDHSSEFQLLKTYYMTKWISQGGTGYDANISSKEKGIHCIAYGLPITKEKSLELRRWLGDDPVRVHFDEDPQGKPTQILWTSKGKDEIRPLHLGNLLAKPFWSKLLRKHLLNRNKLTVRRKKHG